MSNIEHIVNEFVTKATKKFAKNKILREKDGCSGYSPAYSFDWKEFSAHKEKSKTRVIDYRDRSIAFLERQYKSRERYYRKLHNDTPSYSD